MKTPGKSVDGPKNPGVGLTIDHEPHAGNGEDLAAGDAARLSDVFIAATALPNLDGRGSVLRELPKDLFIEGREDFAVAEVSRPARISFGHPKDWAMVHPDRSRFKVMLCLKDSKNRKILPITQSLVRKTPRLQTACRPHVIRQAVLLDGPFFLWPAPWPGAREYPGDEKHREAQQAALHDWTKMAWLDIGDWDVVATETPNAYPHPDWSEAEDFELFLQRGILPILLSTGDEPYLRRFLGRGR
jgi:hypothetical protein